MPSTSGLVAQYPRKQDKLVFFQQLKELRDELKSLHNKHQQQQHQQHQHQQQQQQQQWQPTTITTTISRNFSISSAELTLW